MKIGRAIIFIIFTGCLVNAQEPNCSRVVEPMIQLKVERGGWTQPVFADRVDKIKVAKSFIVDGIEVNVKLHTLSNEQLVTVEGCTPEVDEKNTFRDSVVRSFRTYEVQGRVFAYYVVFYIVEAENGRITERYGASGNVHYVDEDGDGTFEFRCGSMELTFLPAWVKALAANSSNATNKL